MNSTGQSWGTELDASVARGTEFDAMVLDASETVRERRIQGMRKPRELQEGAVYHVTARANRKEMIFDNKGMKDLFLEVLVRAREKYRFRIDNFCVMGNHIHLMIRPGEKESLSRIMQWILSVFAMAYNRVFGYTGHVWGCRFFSRIMASFQQFVKIFEYIDRNPVEANQVEEASNWHYGGLWHDCHGVRGIVDGLEEYIALAFPGRGLLLLESD